MKHYVLRDAFTSQDEALESYTPRRRPVAKDWWTPSPIHGDGWFYCADTGAWENHWALAPLAQSEAAKRDLIF